MIDSSAFRAAVAARAAGGLPRLFKFTLVRRQQWSGTESQPTPVRQTRTAGPDIVSLLQAADSDREAVAGGPVGASPPWRL